MFNLFKKSSVNRYPFIREIKSPVTKSQLIPLDEKCRVVQFGGLGADLTDSDHQKLSEFLKQYPDMSFRVYVHTLQDLSFLKYYSFCKNVQIDVFDLHSLDGIEHLSEDMEFFGFGITKRKFSLNFLSKFTKLKQLYLQGHTKDIEIISKLTNLERLTLREITLSDLSILTPLKKLWWLAIKLGGTKNLSHLSELKSLKYLELWMIKELEDLSPISGLENLQFLFLQDLKNVKELPDFSKCSSLKRIYMESLKGLSDISSLLQAKSLEDLLVVSGNNFKPEDFAFLKNHTSLKIGNIGLGSARKNEEVKKMLNLSLPESYPQFEFKFK